MNYDRKLVGWVSVESGRVILADPIFLRDWNSGPYMPEVEEPLNSYDEALGLHAHVARAALAHLQDALDPFHRQRLAAFHADLARAGRPRPLVQLGEDPALLLEQECLDGAQRRAMRRGDRQPAGIHADAERAPVPAHARSM